MQIKINKSNKIKRLHRVKNLAWIRFPLGMHQKLVSELFSCEKEIYSYDFQDERSASTTAKPNPTGPPINIPPKRQLNKAERREMQVINSITLIVFDCCWRLMCRKLRELRNRRNKTPVQPMLNRMSNNKQPHIRKKQPLIILPHPPLRQFYQVRLNPDLR